MLIGTLPLAYLGWHYSLALKDLTRIYRNLVVFVYHFFSLPVLVKTFFAPWRRLGERYRPGSYPQAWLETLILNTIMRLVGIIARLALMVVGLVALGLAVVLGLLSYLVWLALPWLIAILFLTGLKLLF